MERPRTCHRVSRSGCHVLAVALFHRLFRLDRRRSLGRQRTAAVDDGGIEDVDERAESATGDHHNASLGR